MLAEVDPDVISCNKIILKLFRSTGGAYINASSKPDTYPRRPSNCVYDSIYAKLLLGGRIVGVHTSKRSIEDGV